MSQAGERPERETGRAAHSSPRGCASPSAVGSPAPETQAGPGGPGPQDVSAPCSPAPRRLCSDSCSQRLSPLREGLGGREPSPRVAHGSRGRPAASACHPPVPMQTEAESGPPGVLTRPEGAVRARGRGGGADAELRGDPAPPPPTAHLPLLQVTPSLPLKGSGHLSASPPGGATHSHALGRGGITARLAPPALGQRTLRGCPAGTVVPGLEGPRGRGDRPGAVSSLCHSQSQQCGNQVPGLRGLGLRGGLGWEVPPKVQPCLGAAGPCRGPAGGGRAGGPRTDARLGIA